MKFVCKSCENFLLFEKVEAIAEGSLGLTFACPTCSTKIAMVTNAGETQLVHALGVQIGGKTEAPKPFELIQESLREPNGGDFNLAGSLGKCPFGNMLVSGDMESSTLGWTEGAQRRLENVPEMMRPMVKAAIEKIASKENKTIVDETLMDEARQRFM